MHFSYFYQGLEIFRWRPGCHGTSGCQDLNTLGNGLLGDVLDRLRVLHIQGICGVNTTHQDNI